MNEALDISVFPVPSHREEFLPHRAGPASIPLRKLFHPGCALQFAQGSPYFACAFSSYPGKAGDIFFRSGFHIRYRRKMFPEQFCRGRANARQTLQFSAEGLLRPGLSMPSYGKIVRGVAHTLEKEQLRAAFPDIQRVGTPRDKNSVRHVARTPIRMTALVPCLGATGRKKGQ